MGASRPLCPDGRSPQARRWPFRARSAPGPPPRRSTGTSTAPAAQRPASVHTGPSPPTQAVFCLHADTGAMMTIVLGMRPVPPSPPHERSTSSFWASTPLWCGCCTVMPEQAPAFLCWLSQAPTLQNWGQLPTPFCACALSSMGDGTRPWWQGRWGCPPVLPVILGQTHVWKESLHTRPWGGAGDVGGPCFLVPPPPFLFCHCPPHPVLPWHYPGAGGIPQPVAPH